MVESFELVIQVATPVCLNHPWLHLDGIVGHLIDQRRLGRDYYLLPTKSPEGRGDARGSRYEHVLCWRQEIPFGSISFFEPDAVHAIQYFKRFEPAGYEGHTAKVNLSSGYLRNWMLNAVYQATHTVRFYGRGHLDLLAELLEDLTALGNDTRIGWGEITSKELRPLPEDHSLVWQGRAQRPLPVRYLKRWSDSVPLAWRPPYWAARNVELCAPPGAEVEWK